MLLPDHGFPALTRCWGLCPKGCGRVTWNGRLLLDNGFFIALLSPSIAFVLAVAFFILGRSEPARPYVDLLAYGYLASGIGFLLQRFELPVGFLATKLLSNASFLAAGYLIAAAIAIRVGRRPPYAALTILCAAGLSAFVWFMYVQPDFTWRILTMNFAMGAITLLIALELRATPGKSLIDRLLLAGALISSFNFFVRTLTIVWLHGPYTGYEGFYTSAYWNSVVLSHAILSLAIALCLFWGAALDVFNALRADAETDGLSHLLNRRGFEDKARALIEARAGEPRPLVLVLADLDHFKAVNDAHGHSVGDARDRRILAHAGAGRAERRTDRAHRRGGIRRAPAATATSARRVSLPRGCAAAFPTHGWMACPTGWGGSPQASASAPWAPAMISAPSCAVPTTRSTRPSAAAGTASALGRMLLEPKSTAASG